MRRAAKITISLPAELLAAVERSQRQPGETRSEVIARLIEGSLRQERERAEVERYVRGYRAQPETSDEVAMGDRLSSEAAAWDPWP